MITPEELPHLRRCVELATEALDAGDEPFGSVLVDRNGRVVAEDRNRVVTLGDVATVGAPGLQARRQPRG